MDETSSEKTAFKMGRGGLFSSMWRNTPSQQQSTHDYLTRQEMENQQESRPWQPKPFSIAVLDSDEYLADTLCDTLRSQGFAATAFYDTASLMRAHETKQFDAYVLDYLADWFPKSRALEDLIASIRTGTNGDTPIFILGNQIEPERVERLRNILMQHKVRYLLKPIQASYLAKRIGEAVAKRTGL